MFDMEANADRLAEVLTIVTNVCDELSGYLDKERDALMAHDAVLLEEIVRCKEDCLRRMAKLEIERQNISRALGDNPGELSSSMTLTRLAKRLPAPSSARMIALGEQLLESFKTLCARNRRNATLLRHAQYYNRQLFSLLAGTEPVYNWTGHPYRPVFRALNRTV